MNKLMTIIRLLSVAGILHLLVACSTVPPKPVKNLQGFKVVYLHGFGGKREDPHFLRAMRDFQDETDITFELVNRNWNSVKIDYMNIKDIGLQWRQAVENAADEAKVFRKELAELEAGKTPYYLTAYSLGTKVVLDALQDYPSPLTLCRGIYFMGSAVPRDYELKTVSLPKGMKIINYYSPEHDTVLDISFRTSEGKVAGGQEGFDDTDTFTNYRCCCTHVHKGVGIHSDWSQLATPIGYLILWQEGVEIPGKVEPNIHFRVSEGTKMWHDIILFENVKIKTVNQHLLIQQHKLGKHFRAIAIRGPKSKRYRVAWGNNLHAILSSFSLFNK